MGVTCLEQFLVVDIFKIPRIWSRVFALLYVIAPCVVKLEYFMLEYFMKHFMKTRFRTSGGANNLI